MLCIVCVLLFFFSACGTTKQSEQAIVAETETMGIEEYIYPSEFIMGENLKTAITQLALSYEEFGEEIISDENWKENFVAKFIQNSRISFTYLDDISEKNNGQISMEELSYIHYSLTNSKMDFSSYADCSINRNDAASSLNYGHITKYDYDCVDEKVRITAELEVGYEGMASLEMRKITVELVQNPYSCFDGYSIVSLSSETIRSNPKVDNDLHIFWGTDMLEEENGVFPFEFLRSEDGLAYKHFVYVDMTQEPEMAELVRQNQGKDFKITFIWSDTNSDVIENVVPVDMELIE